MKIMTIRRGTSAGMRSEGQAIIEFALLIPFIMSFFFIIADMGFFAYSYISVANAVREGARCAAVGGTDSAVTTRVVNTTGGLTNTVTATIPTRGATIGSDVVVRAEYTYSWISPVGLIPGVNLSNMTYAKTATMRMETVPPYTKATC